jgi:hypothetical protein
MLLTLSLSVTAVGFALWLVGMLRAGAREVPWPTRAATMLTPPTTVSSSYDGSRRLPSGIVY